MKIERAEEKNEERVNEKIKTRRELSNKRKGVCVCACAYFLKVKKGF